MGLSSLHVCMDSSDHWLQGTIHEESGMDSSSSPSAGDMMLTCSTRPGANGGGAAAGMMERRLRPPHHDQAQKCPRCDSTHTKFCYYNNYSLSQPRYFCKTCRRYWTKGGTLRNIPVGGGCRKNKKVSSNKKSSSSSSSNNNNNDNLHNLSNNNNQNQLALMHPNGNGPSLLYHHSPKDLQLSFPDVQFSHLSNFLGANGGLGNPNFMLESPRPIDFMESKLEGIIGSTSSSRNFDFFGSNGGGGDNIGMAVGLGDNNIGVLPSNSFHGFGAMSLNDGGNYMMDSSSCQRLMLPYDHHHHGGGEEHDSNAQIDVKPNPKLLSLEWQQDQQGCSDHAGKESSFGYHLNGPGSWSGMINGYGSSTTNPLV